LLINPKVD